MDDATRPAVPERPRTQAERTALSDELMLEAAIRLIVDRGTARTTLKDIGERAGYSRGLASYRFGNKAGVFRAVCKHVSGVWVEQLEASVRDRTGLDALLVTIDVHHRFVVESPDHLRAMLILWFESIGPGAEFKGNVAQVHQVQRDGAARWIEDGIANGSIRGDIDPRAFAARFCGSIYGIVYQWLVNPEVVRVAPLYEQLKVDLSRLLSHPS